MSSKRQEKGDCLKVLALLGGTVPLSLGHFSAYVGFLGDQETAQGKVVITAMTSLWAAVWWVLNGFSAPLIPAPSGEAPSLPSSQWLL